MRMGTRTGTAVLATTVLSMCALSIGVALAPLAAQSGASAPVEVPLRVEGGRLLVTVNNPDGAEFDFVLGLGMTLLTESGRAAIGEDLTSLTLGGIPVVTEQAQTVPDELLATEGTVPAGVLGGLTLVPHDVLIDAPNGRLVLRAPGRATDWEGVALSNAVPMQVYHDVLARVDVEVQGELFGGLLDLSGPVLDVNEAVRASTGFQDGTLGSFRMGYAGWSDVPVRVTDSPLFRGWDPDGEGFVIVGAPVARECAIAISWARSEFRTCLR